MKKLLFSALGERILRQFLKEIVLQDNANLFQKIHIDICSLKDIIYIRALWEDMLAEKYLHLDTLLNGQSFPTLVCGVVGLLSETICVKCHYSDLASKMVVDGLHGEFANK